MPQNLILVRHGESEGNKFHHHSGTPYPPDIIKEFTARHSSIWHLTNRGIAQAHLAGKLLRSHFPDGFDRYITSDYVRAIETAAHLELPKATWHRSPLLVERDWGELERYAHEERLRIFAESMARHEREGMFWRPDMGERMLDVATRLFWVLDTLHRSGSEKSVVIVCHGEVIQVFRIILERVPPEDYPSWYAASDSNGDWKLPNGGIVHYTRKNPKNDGTEPYMGWVRIIAPNDKRAEEPRWSPWRTITRKTYTSTDLLDVAAKYPKRLIE